MIDTIIVCTATAIVIVLSGQYGAGQYSPKSNVINFENTNISKENKSWQIISKNKNNRLVYTKNPTEVASFNTPLFDVVSTNKTWYGTPTKKVLGDGIQFSTKRGPGNYAIILRDKLGNKVTSFNYMAKKKC